MEYQKIANLMDDTSNQPSKFRTKNWVEINNESRAAYNVNSQTKFKTTMLKSSLCDYSDAYILVILTSTDIKLPKTQLSKMIQSGGFLGRLLGPLLKTGLPLMKSIIKPSAKSVLIPLGLTATASAADAGIHKKILGSGHNNNTILIISNDEMDDILKIIKSLEDSGVLLKGVSERIQHEAKEQRGGFLSM